MKSPHFLNVDLVIESKSSLRPLAREFGKNVIVMFSGRMNGRHWLIVGIAGCCMGLERTVSALCVLIERLSPDSKQIWDKAQSKQFDIGYEARLSSERANRFSIRPNTIRRVAKLGAGFTTTLYREDR